MAGEECKAQGAQGAQVRLALTTQERGREREGEGEEGTENADFNRSFDFTDEL